MLSSRDDWRKLKEKYGIPDGVCKFSMGERVDLWRKKDAAGSAAKDFKAKETAVDALLKDMKTYEDALKVAKPDKFKGKTAQEKTKNLQDAKVAFHKELTDITGIRDNYSRLANPMAELKTQLQKSKTQLATIRKDDIGALRTFYGQQIRNDVGLPVIQVLKMNPDPTTKIALEAYQKQANVANTLSTQDDGPKLWAACQLALAGLSFGIGA